MKPTGSSCVIHDSIYERSLTADHRVEWNLPIDFINFSRLDYIEVIFNFYKEPVYEELSADFIFSICNFYKKSDPARMVYEWKSESFDY